MDLLALWTMVVVEEVTVIRDPEHWKLTKKVIRRSKPFIL
jgi:hypothetical protein